MSFSEDIPAFFSDFGVDVTVGGQTVVGLFDLPAGTALEYIAGNKPSVLIPNTVTVDGGDTVVVNGATYTVATVEPEATGRLLHLTLEAV